MSQAREAARSGAPMLKRVASGVLGYASGLPFLLVLGTFAFWLREAGVGLAAIGLLSWASIAYSLKFLIAPFMDTYALGPLGRALGRRRAWIFLMQSGVAIGLGAMATGDPASGLPFITVACFLTAACAASQDAAVDGWRVEAAGAEEQGLLVAAYQLGYRLALLTSGAGALYLANGFGWPGAYSAMAAIMAVVALLTVLIVPRTARDDAPREVKSAGEALGAPVRDLIALVATTPLTALLMIGLYRAPDQLANVMSAPLYTDLGFTKPEIANVTKVFGVVLSIGGAFLGGFLLTRMSLKTVLVIGIVASSATNLLYGALATAGHSIAWLTATIGFDNVASAVAGTALIAFMSKLAASEFSATRYAVLSSIYALPGHLLAGGSGFLAEAIGYVPYFTLTFLSGLPALVLCLTMDTKQHDRTSVEVKSFVQAVSIFFTKYGDFTGRANRREFWFSMIFVVFVTGFAFVLDGSFFSYGGLGPAAIAVSLIIFIPVISVTVRRLHDTNRSGFWYLLNFVPVIGTLALLFLLARKGASARG